MTEKRNRDKVIAEITVSHLMRLAIENGCPVSREQALVFFNRDEPRAGDVEAHDAGWLGFLSHAAYSHSTLANGDRRDPRFF